MPEGKVLEKLNVVSTGKRLANMVRVGLKTLCFLFLREPVIRNCTIRTLDSGKKYTREKNPVMHKITSVLDRIVNMGHLLVETYCR